jgi:hypothetical protein
MAARASRASFDGDWSVLVMTDAGPCDQAYRYALRIAGGRLYYAGSGGVDVSGQVSPSGYVRVRVRQGDAYADGTGQLVGAQGRGRWSGVSAQQRCVGHWEAERRGDFPG